MNFVSNFNMYTRNFSSDVAFYGYSMMVAKLEH